MSKLNLLSEKERSLVKHEINHFDKTGLRGQFPSLTAQFEDEGNLRTKRLELAEKNVLEILATDEFRNYCTYCSGPKCCVMVTEELSRILEGTDRPKQVTFLWSAQQYNLNHNLMLVLIEGRLEICTAEYVHQSQHMSRGVHWYRILSGMQKNELDSSRLMAILKILSRPTTAREYLRAHVRALEEAHY